MTVIHFVVLLSLVQACLLVSARRCSGDGTADKFSLAADYAVASPPAKPTTVLLDFTVGDIVDVNDVKNVRRVATRCRIFDVFRMQELEVQGYLRLRWNDTRLSVRAADRESDGAVLLDERCIDALWTPDVWIESLVSFKRQQVMRDLARLVVMGDHEVQYWQRWDTACLGYAERQYMFRCSISLRVSCPMDLDSYPLDTQRCLMRFSASEIPVDVMPFLAIHPLSLDGLQADLQVFEGGVRINDDARKTQGALQYNVTLEPVAERIYHTRNCATKGATRKHPSNAASIASSFSAEPCWPQIAAWLRLERHFKNHGLQVFLPTACLVVLSWISFLIPPYIVPGRMVLLVTLLLVLFGSYATN